MSSRDIVALVVIIVIVLGVVVTASVALSYFWHRRTEKLAKRWHDHWFED